MSSLKRTPIENLARYYNAQDVEHWRKFQRALSRHATDPGNPAVTIEMMRLALECDNFLVRKWASQWLKARRGIIVVREAPEGTRHATPPQAANFR